MFLRMRDLKFRTMRLFLLRAWGLRICRVCLFCSPSQAMRCFMRVWYIFVPFCTPGIMVGGSWAWCLRTAVMDVERQYRGCPAGLLGRHNGLFWRGGWCFHHRPLGENRHQKTVAGHLWCGRGVGGSACVNTWAGCGKHRVGWPVQWELSPPPPPTGNVDVHQGGLRPVTDESGKLSKSWMS